MVSLCFLVWISFFDTNNIPNQLALYEKYREFEVEKTYYQKEISVLKQKLKELTTIHYMERFARQRYNFKKKGEDIYLIKQLSSQKNQPKNQD